MKYSFRAFAILLFWPVVCAHASDHDEAISLKKIRDELRAEKMVESGKGQPRLTNTDLEYAPPMEPSFPETKFLKLDPPRNLQERIDRLLHGVYTDIPPEYDHYGYAIRRYMSHVGGPHVLGNPHRLQKELKNIRRAKIVFDYWNRELSNELAEIELELENGKDISSRARTMFKYNQGIIRAFLIELRYWLINNEALLQFLSERRVGADYVYEDPVIEFEDNDDRLEFISLYKARQKALLNINEYAPFGQMVY